MDDYITIYVFKSLLIYYTRSISQLNILCNCKIIIDPKELRELFSMFECALITQGWVEGEYWKMFKCKIGSFDTSLK